MKRRLPLQPCGTEDRQDARHYGWVFFALSLSNGLLGYLDSQDHLTTAWDEQAFPIIMGLYMAASFIVTVRPRWIEPTFVVTLVATTVYQVGIMYLAIHQADAVSYYSAASGASYFPLVYVGLFIVSARRATLYSTLHCLGFFGVAVFSAVALHGVPPTPLRTQAQHLLYAMLLSHPIYILALRYIVRLRERLHLANQAAYEDKASFLGMLSHEIRNQLQTMVVALDQLERRLHAAPDRKVLGRLQHATQHLQTYLTDLNEYTRLDNPTLKLKLEPLDAQALLEEVCDEWLDKAQAKGLTLTLQPVAPGATPPCLSDRVRLRQVLGNLVSNAIKYTPSGGITLRANGQDKHVCLSVHDTGIGIAQNEQARVFQPHTRLNPAEAREAEGFGLGLAIAHKLVQSLGGHMTLHSAPGIGSTFEVWLPLETPKLQNK